MLVFPSGPGVVATFPHHQKVEVILAAVAPFIRQLGSHQHYIDGLVEILLPDAVRYLHSDHLIYGWNLENLNFLQTSLLQLSRGISEGGLVKPSAVDGGSSVQVDKVEGGLLLFSSALGQDVFKTKLFQTAFADEVVFSLEEVVLGGEDFFWDIRAGAVDEAEAKCADKEGI